MERESLRIGNIVKSGNKWHNSDYAIVAELHGQYLFHESYDVHGKPYVAVSYYDKTEGIPLTEEWLLRLGAKKYGDKAWLPLTNLKSEFHFEIHEKEIVTSIESDFSALILDPVKYVHQLQNLFHSLAGDELCVK